MDFGNAPKVSAVIGVPAAARSDIIATQGSVAVELPPEQTVQSAQAGDAVRVEVRAQARDARSRAASERRSAAEQRQQRQSDQDVSAIVERRLVIEPRTRSVVLEKKNPETGETVEMVPDEATLKLRIYAHQLAERDREASPDRSIERIA
jgi:hypothetical protein